MCLCRAFETLGYVLVCALIVFVGGYVGKGLWLANDPDSHWHAHMIASSEFWEPDYTFWLFGLLSLALVIALSVTIWLLCEGAQSLLKYLCCKMACVCLGWCGCSSEADELDDVTELLDDGQSKRRQKKKKNQRHRSASYERPADVLYDSESEGDDGDFELDEAERGGGKKSFDSDRKNIAPNSRVYVF
jgi:hypothetical protein